MFKYKILGLGQVGMGFLRFLVNDVNPTEISLIDCDKNVIDKFKSLGCVENNFECWEINSKNYQNVFSNMESGGYIFDFVDGVGNYDLCKMALEKNIHYLSTCDDMFDDKFNCHTFQRNLERYKKLEKENKNKSTCIVQFGMNPGMISILTKKAIIDIVENDTGDYVSSHRDELKQMLNDGKYSEVVKNLEVTYISLPDIDITETNIIPDENTGYSTWNVPEFFIETTEKSIIKLGTMHNWYEMINNFEGIDDRDLYYFNRKTGELILNKPSANVKKSSYSPIGDFIGEIVSHEEMFSMYDYFATKEDDNIVYAPTIYFCYKPSNLALDSVTKCLESGRERMDNEELITIDKIISGGEAVGVIVSGNKFSSRYVGQYMPLKNGLTESPTTYQVAISSYSAFKYMERHCSNGLLFPEYLDVNEIFEYCMPYFKEIISCNVPK